MRGERGIREAGVGEEEVEDGEKRRGWGGDLRGRGSERREKIETDIPLSERRGVGGEGGVWVGRDECGWGGRDGRRGWGGETPYQAVPQTPD